MVTFTFMVCTEPYKFQGLETMLELGKAIIANGHEVKGIFFYGSGVHSLKKDISTGSDTRNVPVKLEAFSKEHGIPVIGCTTWIGLCGLKEHDFIESGKEEGLGDLATWVAGSDKLVVFGSGV